MAHRDIFSCEERILRGNYLLSKLFDVYCYAFEIEDLSIFVGLDMVFIIFVI